ncbi:thiamine phosphate synthase [Alkalicoccus halolimnae]|uniref:Thiamine phosphate synthase n=1 Tax=Alkalicoccus halolimnae TaxID=1667239 RepID=A0AAJ8LVE2_9BACI|nr:thiamine phosphate synthase [Alkalicoccus halolimnae]
MKLHALSPGNISHRLWVEKALKISRHVDFLHLREPEWKNEDTERALYLFTEAGGDPRQIILNTKTAGWKNWNGKIHYPEHELPRLGQRKGSVSVHSLESAGKADEAGAEYIIFGPVYEPRSKTGVQGVGLKKLTEVVKMVSVPVIAVGGITPERVRETADAGAAGAAVISGIFYANDPRGAAASYRERSRW